MTSKFARAALFTCALLLTAPVLPPTRAGAQTPVAAASTCANEIGAIDSKIQAFDQQVKEDVTGFLVDGAADAALADARSVLKNRTSPPSARIAAHSAYQTWIDSFERISKSYGVTLEELETCLATSGCDMLDFSKRQSQAFRKWMESYLSGATQDALARVRSTRSMLDGYVKQLGGTAAGSAMAAVQCMKQYERAQVANADVVDLNVPPTATATAPAPAPAPVAMRRGASKAKLAVVAVGVVGAGAALGYALNKLAEPDVSAVTGIAFSGGVGGFGAFFSVRITPAIDQIPISCTWRGSSGRQVSRSTTTSPGGSASCANADVASWPDATLTLIASVTGRESDLTISRVYYP